jgi:sterol desaturase/sphingolipid hydroxylase (fatty acid hydroxylase superfamily)
MAAAMVQLINFLRHAGNVLATTFLSPTSSFSLLSLGCALGIATAFLMLRMMGKRRRRPKWRVLWRALFPGWLWRHASTRADLGFLILNTCFTGALVGGGLLSYGAVMRGTCAVLNRGFGVSTPHNLPLADAIITLALFLAYEFFYWLDHYLKHRIPLLWEFHRVHHTAEVLSPLTVFRVHPVDSLIFANILALGMGVSGGVAHYLLGGSQTVLLPSNNIVLLGFVLTTIHLQHSHIAIGFNGRLGHIVFSPAHHQIHHSIREEHFGRNLGSCLAIWDWMFGTLLLPDRVTQRLEFGADTDDDHYAPHTVAGGLALPFWHAARTLWPETRKPSAVAQLEQVRQNESYCPPG